LRLTFATDPKSAEPRGPRESSPAHPAPESVDLTPPELVLGPPNAPPVEDSPSLREPSPVVLVEPDPIPPPPSLPPLETPHAASAQSGTDASATEAPALQDDRRRREILETQAALGIRSHFELLGVARDATDAQIMEAYFRLAKRFHPDAHHDAKLSDLREQLEAIFIRLGEAYEVLRNPRIRVSYERSLAAGGGSDRSMAGPQDRGQEAEMAAESIRQAARSVAEERYWEAIQLLESAISRAEGNMKQQGRVLLAHAYSKNPIWVKQGEELLQTVLQEDPQNVEAYLLLGGIYRSGRLKSRAAAMFQKVLELSPGHEEALAQLAEIDADASRPADREGFIKRLFKKPKA
jgi:curved DNA-binding protein CbpA